MELMTFIVLLSAIATIGFLTNKYIDRKYGTRPNQDLLDRVKGLGYEINVVIPNKFDVVRDTFKEAEAKQTKALKDFEDFRKHSANLFVAIDKKLTGLHLGEILADKHQEVFELK